MHFIFHKCNKWPTSVWSGRLLLNNFQVIINKHEENTIDWSSWSIEPFLDCGTSVVYLLINTLILAIHSTVTASFD